MSFVVESVVSASIKVLIEKLDSTDLLHFAGRKQIQADLEKWEKTLMKIEAVLVDAEEKQMTNKLVDIWLCELKDLAFDVEDILDEFAVEAQRRMLVNEPQAGVRKLLPECVSGLSPRSLKLNSSLASQIKEISSRLQKIAEEKESFDLNISSSASSNHARRQTDVTTSLHEPRIYGRDKDKEAIIKLLLEEDWKAESKFSVISIEGMGGLGKTTLAQLVYNDPRVETHFKVRSWTCVSDDFNVQRLTKSILGKDAGIDTNNPDLLHVKLQSKLSGKKFLFVLDDVWEEDYKKWTELCKPFDAASSGSKIIVTTRNNSVSKMVGAALPPYLLNELPHDDCLSIFTYHSLGKMNFDEYQDLKEIGEKIVERCKGLPLAAKALGGLLRGETRSSNWNEVLNSKFWNSSADEKDGILPALRVSYYYLPSHLKQCFAYCSIFPKDYAFGKEQLILLWMVEGFLETHSHGKWREDLGEDYFNDLHSRSFFKQSKNRGRFLMHDLINDLAQWASKDASLRIENLHEGEKQWSNHKNLRYLSYMHFESEHADVPVSSALKNKMKSLRTFISLSSISGFREREVRDFPSAFFQLRRLKVLSLSGYTISVLPEKIRKLKLLCHLDLSYTFIKFLPASINGLYNLEALCLKYCNELEGLCPDMGNLIKLQFLCITGARKLKLENVPLRIGRTTFRKLEKNEKGLENLELKWVLNCDDSSNKLDHKLISLEVKNCGFVPYRKWLHDISSSLVSLKIENCASLPSLGQLPFLKKLVIECMSEVESLGSDFYGPNNSKPFQSLEELHISHGRDWTDWIPYDDQGDVVAFPRLRVLSLFICWKLQGKLPDHLPSLERLSIYSCPELVVSIPMLPEHCHIWISRCNGMELESVRNYCPNLHLLSGISKQMLLVEGIANRSSEVGKLDVIELCEPDYFRKSKVRSAEQIDWLTDSYHNFLICLQEKMRKQELPSRFEYLALYGCESAEKLEQLFEKQTLLRVLSLRDLNFMIDLLQDFPLPSQLISLLIHRCNATESLPKAWMRSSNTSLEILVVENSTMKCISKGQLPPKLRMLFVKECSIFTIWDEEEVEASCSDTFHLADSEDESQSLRLESKSYMGEINLSDHGSLVGEDSQHMVRQPNSFHNYMSLEELSIVNCGNMKALPIGISNLTSLKTLAIQGCPISSIPEGGLPTSLTCLVVKHTEFCESLLEWGLHRLTSLKLLDICGFNHVTSFPQEETGMILPTSLIGMRIESFPNMERLSSTAQNQPSLKYLCIHSCKKFRCLPDGDLLASLETLSIYDCPLLCAGPELQKSIDFSNIPGMQVSKVIIDEFWSLLRA